MIFSGYNFMSVPEVDSLSFYVPISVDSIDGSGSFGFSGSGTDGNARIIEFDFQDGKIKDPNNNIVGSYFPNTQTIFSGEINPGSHIYYIDNHPTNLSGTQDYFKLKRFFYNSEDLNITSESKISVQQPTIEFTLPSYMDISGSYTGSFVKSENFHISRGELRDGDTPKFSLVDTDFNSEDKTGSFVLTTGEDQRLYIREYSFDLFLETDAGNMNKRVLFTGFNPAEGTIEFHRFLTGSNKINRIRNGVPITPRTNSYAFYYFITESGIHQPKPFNVQLNYITGLTGIFSGYTGGLSIISGGSGYSSGQTTLEVTGGGGSGFSAIALTDENFSGTNYYASGIGITSSGSGYSGTLFNVLGTHLSAESQSGLNNLSGFFSSSYYDNPASGYPLVDSYTCGTGNFTVTGVDITNGGSGYRGTLFNIVGDSSGLNNLSGFFSSSSYNSTASGYPVVDSYFCGEKYNVTGVYLTNTGGSGYSGDSSLTDGGLFNIVGDSSGLNNLSGFFSEGGYGNTASGYPVVDSYLCDGYKVYNITGFHITNEGEYYSGRKPTLTISGTHHSECTIQLTGSGSGLFSTGYNKVYEVTGFHLIEGPGYYSTASSLTISGDFHTGCHSGVSGVTALGQPLFLTGENKVYQITGFHLTGSGKYLQEPPTISFSGTHHSRCPEIATAYGTVLISGTGDFSVGGSGAITGLEVLTLGQNYTGLDLPVVNISGNGTGAYIEPVLFNYTKDFLTSWDLETGINITDVTSFSGKGLTYTGYIAEHSSLVPQYKDFQYGDGKILLKAGDGYQKVMAHVTFVPYWDTRELVVGLKVTGVGVGGATFDHTSYITGIK